MSSPDLFLIVLFSAVGFGYFIYGIRQRKGTALLSGFILIIYPYFVSGWLSLTLAGLLLMAIPFIARRIGL